MSNFYYDNSVLAAYPRPTTREFPLYLESYRQIRRERALEMAIDAQWKYYFSLAGNDANDGLTINTPKRTGSAAQTILTNWQNDAGGLALHFLCGDIRNPDTDGKLDFSGRWNVAFTNYGDRSLDLPFWSRWKTAVRLDAFNDSADRADAFTNTYSVAKPGSETWYTIRPYGRRDVAFRHVASIAEVDANPGTCFVNLVGDGTLYFRPFTTRTQLFDYYECLTPDPTPTVAMIGNNNTTGTIGTGEIAVVGVEISGVCVDTYGAESNAANAINLRGYGDAILNVLDSCITYSSRHHIVTASGTGSQESFEGTILFIDNCYLGWQSSAGGSTLVVANSIQGGSEMFASNCTILGGYIPRPGVADGGVAFYTHGNSPSIINTVYNCHASATPGQIALMAGFDNVSTAATLDDVRHVVYGCSIPHRHRYLNDGPFDGVNRFSANNIATAQLVINCKVGMTQLGSTQIGGTINASNITAGHYVNTEFEVDLGIDASRPASDFMLWVSAASQIQCSFFSCTFAIKNLFAGRFAWVGNQATSGTKPAAQYVANRCLFINRSGMSRQVNLFHPTAYYGFNAEECAYACMNRYFANSLVPGADYLAEDDLAVLVPTIPMDAGVPDELARDTDSVVVWNGVSYPLEYDAKGLPRAGLNAIGPHRLDATLPTESENDTYSTTYTPGIPWNGEVEEFDVPIGSGVPFEFVADPEQIVDAAAFEATAVRYGNESDDYSVAGGNMEVAVTTGVVLVNPLYTETLNWLGTIYLNLWQVEEDDSRMLLKQLKLKMYSGGSP